MAADTHPAATPTEDGVNGHMVVDAPLRDTVSKFAAGGLILPPPDIKSVIDRTATFVVRSANPTHFEDRIRENQQIVWRKLQKVMWTMKMFQRKGRNP